MRSFLGTEERNSGGGPPVTANIELGHDPPPVRVPPPPADGLPPAARVPSPEVDAIGRLAAAPSGLDGLFFFAYLGLTPQAIQILPPSGATARISRHHFLNRTRTPWANCSGVIFSIDLRSYSQISVFPSLRVALLSTTSKGASILKATRRPLKASSMAFFISGERSMSAVCCFCSAAGLIASVVSRRVFPSSFTCRPENGSSKGFLAPGGCPSASFLESWIWPSFEM